MVAAASQHACCARWRGLGPGGLLRGDENISVHTENALVEWSTDSVPNSRTRRNSADELPSAFVFSRLYRFCRSLLGSF